MKNQIHPSPAGGGGGGSKKGLRRLPNVYSKVLELPLPADTDVAVFERPDAFHFVAAADGCAAAAAAAAGVVRVRTVRIHPGVVKVVVQAGAGGGGDGDGLELNRWRSRLPEASCPAMAVAGYVNGQLVVTVPKGRGDDEGDGEGGDGVWRCRNEGRKISGRLVAVQ